MDACEGVIFEESKEKMNELESTMNEREIEAQAIREAKEARKQLQEEIGFLPMDMDLQIEIADDPETNALIAPEEDIEPEEDEFASEHEDIDFSGLEKIYVDSWSGQMVGQNAIKDWTEEMAELLQPEKQKIMAERRIPQPRGIMIVGKSGFGKAKAVKFIAANLNLPLFRMDMASLQGPYIGHPEQALRHVLSVAESVAPCILWINDIDRELCRPDSDGGSGDDSRIMGQFMIWRKQCKASVFVVATSNDDKRLPASLLQNGYFDYKFEMEAPTLEEKKDLMNIYFQKYMHIELSDEFLDEMARRTPGYTAAKLLTEIRKIAYRVIADEELVLTEDLIKKLLLS